MTPERWQQLEALFHAVVDLPPEARAAALSAACGSDADLRAQVERLLAAHVQASAFVSGAAAGVERVAATLVPDGAQLGAYRVVRELGRGGMGTVYLGERADAQFEMRVAIKLIKRGMDTDAVLQRFRHERQILAGLQHPNIGRLLDGGTTADGAPYFVMEYVEGEPIDEYCRTRHLPVESRLRLIREVCAAVSYAHQHLVVHRDIKPSNILVTPEGVPKLLDFGIAKLLDAGPDATLATELGAQAMTPQYASPEQLRGERVTTASDVYALGVLLYELLAGARPYDVTGKSRDEVQQIASGAIPKPSAMAARGGYDLLARRLRGDLDSIVMTAMRPDPAERYASAALFADDVRRHMDGLPVVARGDSWTYRSARFVRRRKLGVAAAAAVVLTLIGGVIATSWQARVARAERARAERRFNDVRKLANSVLFEYHDAIAALPGATPVRERLVKDALVYLDSLAAEAASDPALQRELAAAYDRIGDVRGRPSGASLGDVAGAIDSYERALRIRQALVAASPHDPQGRRDLAISHRTVGYRLLSTGETARGLEHLRGALATFRELTLERAEDAELQFELARTQDQLGVVLRQSGDLSAAFDQYNAALAICEKLAASHPLDRRYRQTLHVITNHLGLALYSRREIDAAIAVGSKAIALGEALVAEDPTNTDYRRALVDSYQSAGDYRRYVDSRGALEYFLRAAALDEEALAVDPANAIARRAAAYTHKRIADFLANQEDHARAVVHFDKALQLFQRLGADAPEDLPSRLLAATCRAGVAGMRAWLGDRAAARDETRKTIALLDTIPADATSVRLQLQRAETYEYLGYAYEALAKSRGAPADEIHPSWSTARDMFQRSLGLLEGLDRRGALDASNAKWAELLRGEIGNCDAALSRGVAKSKNQG